MRVVAGSQKGRRLVSFKNPRIRPTSDKVREAIFNVLGAENFASVLDLFAGTGAMGIEAMSRAEYAECVFIDSDAAAVAVIKKNLSRCGFFKRAMVIKKEALAALDTLKKQGRSFDLVLIDAPYSNEGLTKKTLSALANGGLLKPGGRIVVESSSRVGVEVPAGLTLLKEKRYGDTTVSFMRAE